MPAGGCRGPGSGARAAAVRAGGARAPGASRAGDGARQPHVGRGRGPRAGARRRGGGLGGTAPDAARGAARPGAAGAAALAVRAARAAADRRVPAGAVCRDRPAPARAVAAEGRPGPRRGCRPPRSLGGPCLGRARPGHAARAGGGGGGRVRGPAGSGRLLQHRRPGARRQPGAMAATAAESIGAVKVIHALSLEGTFAQAFTKQSRKNLATGAAATRLEAALERTVDLLIAVATALVLWSGARLVLRGAMTLGDLVIFLAYLRTAFRPAKDFAKYTGRLAKASAAGERVVDLLDRTPDVRDLPGAVPAPPLRGHVRFEGVGFAYDPGHAALSGIDCTVDPGQHVALVGTSGSGKSTFASLILRLYDPTAGRVLIDGRDLRAYTLASLRMQITVVLQDSILFVGTIRDNIGQGAPGASPEAIEAAARLANAHGFIMAQPQGYDTVVGERGVTLSNGQRQRIAIARAAIRHAPILILDEPTTGLDGENERTVIEALERLTEGQTTLLITHNLELAARANLILYLEAGRVRERGTHAELLRAQGPYANLSRLRLTGAGPERYDAVNA